MIQQSRKKMTTYRIAQACLLTMALLSPALTLGASPGYRLDCNPIIKSNPNEHKRVGYITTFQGMGLAPSSLAPDIKVYTPYQGSPASGGKFTSTGNTAQVVGVIEKFEWSGGVGDPIEIDFYVSQKNATQIKTVMQQTLKSMKVDQLGWWIVDYDHETKKWYEQAYPLGSGSPGMVSGIIASKNNPDLNVYLTPVTVNNAVLYKVTLKVAPAANLQYPLFFASSSNNRVTKTWGVKVGMPSMH
jgi:hypothetical protein